MLDNMFQEGTDKVLDDRVSRPLQAPTVRPSFGINVWNTVKSPFAGAGAGANESAGFMSDILGAFGQVQAGYGQQADPTTLFESGGAEKRRQEGQTARDAIQSGEAFSSDIGTGFRATARSFSPDPATANTAEQILFGLGRFATKAVGYSVATGPVVGAVLTGTDEGMTEADRLKGEGVDFATRTKVGVVAGASAAAATALPVAGNTVAQTVGLVAAGGPASFIAQQAASKAILQNADYDKIAAQYDPFDPVGLAVSTLVPAGFGAIAMRGARNAVKTPTPSDPAAARQLAQMGGNERLALKYDDPRLDSYAVTAAQREGIPPEVLLAIKNTGEKSAPTATSPAGAQGVMQFMPETWKSYGKGDPRDPIASIDAGAKYMADLIKQYDGDVRAAIAHYNGGGKAGEAVRAGKRPPAAETQKYLARTDDFLAQHQGEQAGRAAANDPEAVAAARVQQVRETIAESGLHDPADIAGANEHVAALERAQDQLAAGKPVDVVLDAPLTRMEQVRAELSGRISDTAREITDQLRQSAAAVREFVTRSAADATDNKSIHVLSDAVSEAKRARILEEAGIDIGLAREQLRADTVRHAQKSHPDLTPEDWQMLPWVMENFDHVAPLKKGKNDKGPRLGFTATDPVTGYAYVAEALAGTKKGERLSVVSFFRDHPNTVKSWLETNRTGEGKGNSGGKAPPHDSMPPKGSSTLTSETVAATGKNSIDDINSAIKSSLDAQTAEIARLSPDMMVQLEGMEKPMRLGDALEAVKAEAAKEVQDAPLLQVAAECFLRSI